MESLRGRIKPIMKQMVGEEIKSEFMEAARAASSSSSSSGLEMSYGNSLFSFHHYQQMPFLQLLQGAMRGDEEEVEEEEEEEQLHLQFQQQEHQALFTSPYQPQSNLELLLRLQNQQHQNKQWPTAAMTEIEPASRNVEQQLESCVTHASESETREMVHHPQAMRILNAAAAPARCASAGCKAERKKRKRSRSAPTSAKSPAEAESQRMTHIAVERNRRRLMNDHLAALRSLMPSSFVQRGDQASIIGGAIEFIKELEHKLLCLQAEKRLRSSTTATDPANATPSSGGASSNCILFRPQDDEDSRAPLLHDGFFVSPQYTSYTQSLRQYQQLRHSARQHTDGGAVKKEEGEEEQEEGEEEIILGVDVEATVVQGHVNLKVAGRGRAGQLIRAIAAMEELRLSVLHLNITSLDRRCVLYSLNLKMEEECKLGSAEEIATAVHQIFSYINACY